VVEMEKGIVIWHLCLVEVVLVVVVVVAVVAVVGNHQEPMLPNRRVLEVGK